MSENNQKLQTEQLVHEAPAHYEIRQDLDGSLREINKWRLERSTDMPIPEVESVAANIALRGFEEERKVLEKQARTDALTGLPNRRAFDEDFDALLKDVNSGEEKDKNKALIIIDLDGFKQINDGIGHDKGDEMLKSISQALKAVLRDGDMLYRIGGDEFAVIIPELRHMDKDGTDDLSAAYSNEELAEKLIHSLRKRTELTGLLHNVLASASIGYTDIRDSDTAKEVYNRSDQAAIVDKRGKKDRIDKLRSQFSRLAS